MVDFYTSVCVWTGTKLPNKRSLSSLTHWEQWWSSWHGSTQRCILSLKCLIFDLYTILHHSAEYLMMWTVIVSNIMAVICIKDIFTVVMDWDYMHCVIWDGNFVSGAWKLCVQVQTVVLYPLLLWCYWGFCPFCVDSWWAMMGQTSCTLTSN